jgi:hypothetical protein
MNYRMAKILEAEDVGASGTKVLDIKILDVISRIEVKWRAKNSASDLSDHIADCISKIELIDGSEVLFSLSGKQCQAVNFYNDGQLPYNYLQRDGGVWQTATFLLNFGRWLWDKDLAFDPKKFRNPQLRITFDETASESGTTENTLEVYAYTFDEETVSPDGLIRVQEEYSYGLTAGGKQYIDIPTDHILREIYVQALVIGDWFSESISNIKLTENNGKRVPVDMDSTFFHEVCKNIYGYCREAVNASIPDSEKYIFTAPSDDAFPVGCAVNAQKDVQVTYKGGTRTNFVGASSGDNAIIEVRGLLPFAVCPVLNLPRNDMGRWYDVRQMGSLELVLSSPSSATGGSTVNMITEQLYHY